MRTGDVDLAAGSAVEVLAPLAGSDWDVLAGDLEWTCRRTLDHIPDALLVYATHLARRSEQRRRGVRDGDDGASIAQLVEAVQTAAAILEHVAAAAGEDARAFHPAGRADTSGFLAMGADEVLVHTWDIAQGLGATFSPPRDLSERVLRRLFPWAPDDHDPWEALLWANGRQALPGLERLGPDWYWQCAPLEEWDGQVRKRTQPPAW